MAWSWTSAAIAALIDSEFGLLKDLQRTVRFCDDDHSTQGDDDLEYAHYVSLFPFYKLLFPVSLRYVVFLLPTTYPARVASALLCGCIMYACN